MMNIVALSKEKGSSYTEHSSVVTLDSASILKIAISREDIKSFSRVNNDLIVELNDHEKITIKNFFTVGANGQHSDLVLEDPHDGTLWWLENPGTDAAAYTSIDSLAEVGTQTTANEHIGAWTIAGAALLGIGAMLLGASKSDHRHSDNDDSDSESGSKTTTTTGNTAVNGETGDTTAPTEPSGVQLSDDGKTITGKGEAGTTITVTDASGKELGTGTVGAAGTFSVTLTTPQTNGQTLSVVLTDTAGNASDPANVTAKDTTAPTEPSGIQLSDDGKTVTGKGEAGSTVTVKDGEGKELGHATVGSDGNFSVTLPTAQTNGQTLSITSADAAGNTSSAATITAPATDTKAPTEPSGIQLSDDGKTISGKGEAGTTISVKDGEGKELGHATVGSDGTFSVILPTAQTNGQILSVTSTDAAGNTSPATTITARATDTTAPTEPSGVQLSDDGKTITGKGEAGSTVTVTDASGKELGTGAVGADGTFSVTLTTLQTNGQILSVVLTDTAGNTSVPASVTAKDTTVPAEPSGAQLSDDGKTITGKGEAGSTVTVKDAEGNTLVSATVGSDGTFTITLPTAQTNGQTLSVTSTDAAGNTSSAATITAPDTMAPTEPSGIQLSDDGKTITGKGEAGSTVTVKDGEGKELGHATVGSDGTFSVTLPTAQTNGQTLSVTSTDAAGNTSSAATISAPDTTVPAEPSGVQLSDDGLTVTGKGEAGSTVTVKDAEGNTLGSATVGSDGTFSVTLPTAQTNGQTLSVVLTDTAGNASDPASVTAKDTTAPVEPSNVQLSGDGLTVTGKGDVGSTVTVTDASGKALGIGTVGADGTFSVTLATPQTNGQILSVVLTDTAGNASDPASVTAKDTTVPTEPSGVQLSDDGKTITGKGEAGSTVTVKDAEGNTLGSATVGSDGTFSVTLSTAQTNGQTLSVTSADAVGNMSSAKTITAPDTTAPTEPSGIQLSDDGKTISGKGEVGSTVTVTDASGKELGIGTVGADGTFSVTLATPQTNGQILSVVLTDTAGNASDPASVTAKDTTVPAEPSGVQLSDDGKTITGKGEAGSTVTVKDAEGNTLGSATVGSDGTFSVTLPTAQTNGQTLSVTSTDAAGNTSSAATISAPDTTVPAEPSGVQLSDDGLTVTGKGEAGSTVTVKDAEGNTLGSATVGSDGTFSVTLPTAQTNGQTLSVTSTDAAGNTSSAATISAPDTTVPAEPSGIQLSDDGLTVTGKGEAGSTVTVKDAEGNTLGSATVGSDGTFSVTLPTAQTNGQTLSVVLTDTAGNASDPASVTAKDTTAPVEPSNVQLSGDGLTVTGKGDVGSTVTVTDASGKELGIGTVGADGTFSVTLATPQTNGQILSVVSTDTAGNASDAANVTAKDTTAPTEPSGIQLSDDGKTISGKGEVGSTVTVTDASGKALGIGTVGADGTFSVTLATPQTNGQILSVVSTDTAGNASDPASVTAKDSTAPVEPSDVQLDAAGSIVTGKGEVGSTVTVTDASGKALGTGTVGADGTFSVTLATPQTNGQTLSVVSTDTAGNASDAASVIAKDTTAPVEPSDVQLDAAGSIVTGKGEVGSTVTVTDASGKALGTGTVGADGTFSVTLATPQTNGQTLSVVSTDTAGNASDAASVIAKDTTAPVEPSDVQLDAAGSIVTGKGEVGSTVTVTDTSGKELGTGTVGADGSFSVTLTTPQTNGQTLSVTATDAANNTSLATTTTAPDTTAPATPTDVVVSDDGVTVTGKAEAGSTVAIKDAAGTTLGSTTAAADGTFTVTLDPAQTNGQTLSVTATDAGNNTSSAATTTAPDTTAPATPTDVVVSDDGVTVTGKAEAGSKVAIKDAAGTTLGNATAAADGTFTVTLDPAQTNGQTLSVVSTDTAGNASDPASVTAKDTTAPVEPSGIQLSDDGKTISGKGEVGSTVTVTDASGKALGTGTVGADGTFSVTLATPQTNGQTLSVTSADAVGNMSSAKTITAPDTTAPTEPSGVQLSDDGKTVTGKGEAGSTVTVKDAEGNTLGSATVGSDGTFSVTLPTAQTNGQTLSVTSTDAAGNTSSAATISAPDTTVPAEPSGIQLSDDGKTIFGKGEVGSTVTVTDASGKALGTGTVGADGTFSVTLTTPQTNGQILSVVSTDTAGNASDPASVTAKDTTAPATPTDVVVSDDGVTVTGKAEAGSTVAIKDADGTTLGSAKVAADGTFTVTLDPAQTNGQILSVTATDAANNTSLATTTTAPDTTAPATPTDVVVSDDGVTVTGKAEAGSKVAIKDAAGTTLGNATAAADGTFTVTLDPAQTNGQTLSVVSTDTTGNASDPASVTAKDTTAPVEPSGVQLSDDGKTITGKGEAGSTVTVKDAEGNTLGSATVGSDGTFSVTLSTAQTNGQTLSVTSADAVGNTSSAATISAPDTTVPAEPSGIQLSDDGLTVTGKGEAGSTVTVKDAEGNTLGSATVGSDGTFSVTLPTAQTNGQTLSVVLTDTAGNASDPASVTAKDTTAPVEPSNVQLSGDGLTVTGKGDVGSTVTVTDASGKELGIGTVGADGTFSVTLATPQTNGQILSVVSTDTAGNASDAANVTAKDTTAPTEPSGIQLSDDGKTISGKGEVGSTVTVTDASGKALGIGTVGADGTFSVTLATPQTNGQILSVVSTDTAGNASDPASVTAKDSTAPVEPSDVQLDAAGSIVTGKGEVGSTVTVTDASGKALGTGTVGADGTFSVTLATPQTNGQTLSVVSTDTAGNASDAASVIAKDTTAPVEPSDVQLDAAGSIVTGKGEVGSTVTVTDASGKALGTGTVGADGTFSVTLATPQTNGQTLSVVSTDTAGNASDAASVIAKDTTAPVEPSDVQLDAAGSIVTGKGEVGSTVTVTDTSGKELGTGTVGADGSFSVTLTTPQTNGQTLSVTATDAANNTSLATTTTAPDTTAPATPTDVVVSDDGVTVTGKAEAGSTVAIKDAAGTTLGSTTAAADGTFTVTLDPAQTNGQTLSVTATDAGNNTSSAATTTAPDTTAPATPTDVVVSDDGVTVTGKAEAGSKVAIKDAAGTTLGNATAAADGTFTVTLDPAQTNGQTLSVVSTDTAGNASDPASVTAKDTTAPVEPSGIQLSDDGKTISGKGEVGSTVTVTDASGKALGTGTVGADGTFSVTLATPQTNGQTLSVTSADAVGNMSSAKTITAPDTTAPTEPSGVQLSDDGKTVTGKGEAGSTVTVKDAEGNTLGSATVGSDGTFSVTLPTAQTNGQTLSVTSTDAAGNTSSAATISAPDTTVPAEPSGIQLSDDGKTIFGKGEVGSTVTVTDASGKALGTGTVGADGTFSVTLTTPQTNGQTLSIVSRDTAGNTSDPASVTAKDTTAPATPTDAVVSDDGVTVTGKAEAGSTVAIKDADGTTLGSAKVAADGTFTVTLDPAQTNGQILSVTATDAANNTSLATTTTAPDTTAPATPTDVVVSDDGVTVTGKAEAGSKVAIKDAAGTTLGNTTATADGTFTVTLDPAQTNGQTLSVVSTDTAGNASDPSSVTAKDTTAPVEPSDVQLDAAGSIVTGKGEVGSTVTVTDTSGKALGTGTIGADGSFSVTLTTPQTNGQTLSVVSTDTAGNASDPASVTAKDTTAPVEPSDVQLDAAGSIVTGKGEVGSTVTVTDASGKALGTGTVGADGSFSVTLTTPQTNGQILSVVSTDTAGNASDPASVTAKDTTAPVEPSDVQLDAAGSIVTGKGEVGSTVTVTDTSGKALGTGTIGADGSFSVTLTTPQTNGQTLSIVSTDTAGNASDPASVTAKDTTAPTEPSGVQLSDDGKTITGKGEAGSTVTVKDGEGKELGHATVGSDGTFSVTLPTAQTNGQTLSVTSTDAAGNTSSAATISAPDTTVPAEPSGVQLSDDGKTISGKGEVGSTVTVTDASGKALGTGTVGADGSFSVTLATPQTNGQILSVVSTDTAGNASDPASVTAKDTTAPATPTDVVVSDDGVTVTGKAEAGSTVAIKDADGTTLGSAKVAADGTFTVTLDPAQTNGQILSVTATDAANNTSLATTTTAPDTTAPATPTDVVVSDDGVTVTGKAEAGSKVAIKDAAGTTLGNATAAADGTFTVTLDPAQTNGQTLSVVSTDTAGNASDAASVTAKDSTAPVEPSDVQLDAAGSIVTGKGEVGSTVTVTDASGKALGTGTVGADGSFSVTLTTPQTNGQTLSVVSTDTAGNASDPASVTAKDTTAPVEPSDVQLDAAGSIVTGKGEVGSTVTVTDASGKALGTGTVGADGTFSVTLTTPQTNGQILSVVSRDAAGNTSDPASVTAKDTTAPAEPSNVQLSGDGLTVTGKGEVGSTVTVTDASGKALGTGTVGADGTFSVTLTTPQTNGQTLSVVSTDTAGNASDPASVTAKDTTAPATPTDVVVSDDGVTVTGKAEAGSTVAIKDAAGTTLGSATTAADGTFSVTLSTAQTNGQVLSVAASDKAGNTSIATSVTAKDTTAPAAPTDVLLSDDGVTVTGKGEIGSIITVTNINGKALGTGKVDSDGTFSVTLDAAQTNGQTLSVAASDTTGNTSETVSVTAKDTTAPNEPTDLVIDDSSLMLSGKGEEGTTVKVYDSNGNVVASGTVNDDGTFEVKLPEGLSINQDLSVTLTDSSNNESDKGTVTYSDNSGSGTDDQLIANADTHTATVTAVQDNLTGTSGNIVQAVGLTALSVVDISLFSSNTFDFTVSDNTSEDVTLDVSGSVALSAVAGLTSLLSLLGLNNFSADLSVINTSTGEVVQTLSNAISINAGLVNLTYSGSVYIQGLTSGTYTVAVSSANSSSVVGRLLSLLVSANVGTVLSVDITDSVQYVFGETSGNVLSSDTVGDVADTGTSIHVTSVVATSVDGSSAVTVASSGTTIITGEYGILTIAADGSYSYQPTSANSDIGKSDVFTYTITNASGQTATATLTLTIEGTHSTAVADVVSLSDTTVLAAGSSLTYTTDTLVNGVTVAKNAVVTNSVSQSITVASGTTLDDASLVLKFTAANSILNLSTTVVSGTLTILNVTTGESESLTLSNASLLLGTSTSQTISLSDMGLAELTEGNYTITLAYSATNKSVLLGGAALTITSSLSGTSVDTTHHYTVSETTSGNILDGTDSDSVADTFGSQYQSFTMTGNNASGTSVSYTVSGGDKSITDSSGSTVSGDTATLYGKYGTLVISNEGSYTYTLKAGIDTSTITTKETFSYSLNDSDGTSSTAKLTIDLHPVITGSANADTIASTAYDDTFTTGSGADTVVYKLLADDNTGGNGNDTWTDFSAAQGDHIDVSALLVGWDGKSSSLGNYISVSHTDNNTVVSIDRDGTGSHYSSATLVTLENANVTLDELIDHNSSS